MPEPLTKAGIAFSRVSDHTVYSVSSLNEPDSQKRKSYNDLAAALPHPAACEEVDIRIRNIVTTPDFHPVKPVSPAFPWAASR